MKTWMFFACCLPGACTSVAGMAGTRTGQEPSQPDPGVRPALEWVRVSDDGTHFVSGDNARRYQPMGFNYDHDPDGRLLEDYWHEEWSRVEEDFREMHRLGANVVRIHLQFGRFMKAPTEPDEKELERLRRLIALAEETGLYLDLTGLGCYHKQDVPPWYDALEEAARWDAQSVFWEAIAQTSASSPAVFCYDLMNEPVIGGEQPAADWLGPAFAGKHFVQFVARATRGRTRPAAAKQWIDKLAQTRQPAFDHGGFRGLESGPSGTDLRICAAAGGGIARLHCRPYLSKKGRGGCSAGDTARISGWQARGH
jgi:Cellulase (glycosyl hydrolase family 5)